MSGVLRTSISLPEKSFDQLDLLCQQRGYRNRSHALSSILEKESLELTVEHASTLIAGTLTLVIDESKTGLLSRLSALIRDRLDEVIATLTIPLESQKRIDVWVLQGPAQRVKTLVHELQAFRGVISTSLSISTAILPPIHERPRFDTLSTKNKGKFL